VNDVCQSPGHRDGQKRQTENNVVYESDDDDVSHPHSLAAEVRRIRVWIAVSDTDVHRDVFQGSALDEVYIEVNQSRQMNKNTHIR